MAWTNPKTWAVGETLTAANFNTYIRDNMLADGPHLIARKTSDQSVTSSITLVSDTELLTPSIAANEVWLLRLMLRMLGSGGNLKYSWQFPTGGTLDFLGVHTNAAGTAFGLNQAVELTASDGATRDMLGAATPVLWIVEAFFLNGATPGAVTFRWAQATSNATPTTVKLNSTLWGVKLA